MKRSRSIVGIAVGVSTLVLTVAGIYSYRAVEQLARISEDVVSAKELELSLERLLSTVRDAETGQRGFLLSGGAAGTRGQARDRRSTVRRRRHSAGRDGRATTTVSPALGAPISSRP
jgi:hypothetical protein